MRAKLLSVVTVLLMVVFVTIPSITTSEIEEPSEMARMMHEDPIGSIAVSEIVWTTDHVELFNDINIDERDPVRYLAKNTPLERSRIFSNGISVILYNGYEYYVDDANLTKKEPSMADYNRWGIELTDEEIDMLAEVMFLEAHTEPDNSMLAAIEVIFNRILHDEFPNTLEEVLSQSNPTQFTTWELRHLAEPTEKEYELIYAALYGELELLSNDYVYFGRSKQNNNNPILIGEHWFCKC